MYRFPLLILVALSGCYYSPFLEGSYECEGTFRIVVPRSVVPAKVKVVWQGLVAIDECGSTPVTSLASLSLERSAGTLVILDGGTGYRPPRTFELQLVDLGACASDAKTIVDVTDYPAPAVEPDRNGCASAELTLPAEEIH